MVKAAPAAADGGARGNVIATKADVTEDGETTQKILLTTCWDKDCAEDALTTTVQVFE